MSDFLLRIKMECLRTWYFRSNILLDFIYWVVGWIYGLIIVLRFHGDEDQIKAFTRDLWVREQTIQNDVRNYFNM